MKEGDNWFKRNNENLALTELHGPQQSLKELTQPNRAPELQKAWQTPKTETKETSNPKAASLIALQSLRGLKET